jgi:hypothetical protein
MYPTDLLLRLQCPPFCPPKDLNSPKKKKKKKKKKNLTYGMALGQLVTYRCTIALWVITISSAVFFFNYYYYFIFFYKFLNLFLPLLFSSWLLDSLGVFLSFWGQKENIKISMVDQ